MQCGVLVGSGEVLSWGLWWVWRSCWGSEVVPSVDNIKGRVWREPRGSFLNLDSRRHCL